MIQFIEKYFRDGRITIAGKNVAGFDIPFLKNEFPEVVDWFKHRVLDVGPMFYRKGDLQVPDLKTCLERSKIYKHIEHDALGDAEDVIRCIRYKLGVSN
jgi:oligoribonuclease (3'-5' exoribonuclease)